MAPTSEKKSLQSAASPKVEYRSWQTVCISWTSGFYPSAGIANRHHAIPRMMGARTLDYLFPYGRFSLDLDMCNSPGTLNSMVLWMISVLLVNITIPLQPAMVMNIGQVLYGPPGKLTFPTQEKLETCSATWQALRRLQMRALLMRWQLSSCYAFHSETALNANHIPATMKYSKIRRYVCCQDQVSRDY